MNRGGAWVTALSVALIAALGVTASRAQEAEPAAAGWCFGIWLPDVFVRPGQNRCHRGAEVFVAGALRGFLRTPTFFITTVSASAIA